MDVHAVRGGEAGYLAILDEDLDVAWWWAVDFQPTDWRLRPDGHLVGLGDGLAREADLLGNELHRWGRDIG
ncbi:hypothetical protein, partial [Salmonella sp. SAL4438]|uniref:hypothetical protein n=1 Tax=Salmonella sp. SAL4438 TaxID=3159893 RepID=UPI00397E5D9B